MSTRKTPAAATPEQPAWVGPAPTGVRMTSADHGGLEVRQVTVARGAAQAVVDATLAVRPGEVVALIGANGAGKSSLLDAIAGVAAIQSGSVTLDGLSLTGRARVGRVKAGLAYVEQGRTVFKALTVRENLQVVAGHAQRLGQTLEMFPELEKRWDTPAGLLSGGEQQMLGIARALALKPRYLMIDEMSLGLAPLVTMRLMQLLETIRAQGIGVLLVEQFGRLALRHASAAVVMTRGRVVWSGPSAELLAAPHLIEAAYLG